MKTIWAIPVGYCCGSVLFFACDDGVDSLSLASMWSVLLTRYRLPMDAQLCLFMDGGLCCEAEEAQFCC